MSKSVVAAFFLMIFAIKPTVSHADTIIDQLQVALDNYLETRAEPESITNISAHISLGYLGPNIELVTGSIGPDTDEPVTPETLYQIGSNTKAFTAVLLLLLEADGHLSIDDTVGNWLPLYPAWSDVTIRELLHMTTIIPTYSEAEALLEAQVSDPRRHWTPQDLIDFAYPPEKLPPVEEPWFYSNTNYILAGLIIEKASGVPYEEALKTMILEPHGLKESHYFQYDVPDRVIASMSSGFFANADCGLYEPDCKTSALAPLVGHDVRDYDLSWGGAAGGIISTPRDLTKWVRALFSGKVLPREQFDELTELVSRQTGKPIDEPTAEDPSGFSLGLVKNYRPELGTFWFYQGETLGYRAVFAYVPEDDLVMTVFTNSQPASAEDGIGRLFTDMFALLKPKI